MEKRNLPNQLTVLRVLLIPAFVLAYYLPVDWHHIAATAVFILAALTDWLDGYLARKLNASSKFGAFLDPVADKLMVATALVILVQANPTAWMAVPVMLIIAREIMVSALREWMAENNARAQVAVSNIGKFKTATQMLAIVLLVYAENIVGIPVYSIGLVLLYVATCLTLWSMWLYLDAACSNLH